jgi:hypothetical protein
VEPEFESHVAVFGGAVVEPPSQWVYFTQGVGHVVPQGVDAHEFLVLVQHEEPAAGHLLHVLAFALATLPGQAQMGRVARLGEPWIPGSNLDFVYFSPPYLLGLESWHIPGTQPAHWSWVIPITESEANLVYERGPDALEEALERGQAPIGAISRESVV